MNNNNTNASTSLYSYYKVSSRGGAGNCCTYYGIIGILCRLKKVTCDNSRKTQTTISANVIGILRAPLNTLKYLERINNKCR